MRHTELWERMAHALGDGYHRVWAEQQVLAELDGTVVDALDAGVPPRQVWRAVWRYLELPDRER